MANLIIVCGDTGTGKSRSLKTLNSKETFLINVLNKSLPFKGDDYSEEKKNIFCPSSWLEVRDSIVGVAKNRPNIKTIVVDDAGFIMTSELFARSSEKGYDKFTEIGTHMQQILSTAKNQRKDLNIIFIFHEDDEISDRIKIGKKVKTIGMMLEDKYNPLAIVTVALFTDVSFDKDGKVEYNFITNRMMKNGITIPAKSPEGMFEEIKIPNDLGYVVKKINEYYK